MSKRFLLRCGKSKVVTIKGKQSYKCDLGEYKYNSNSDNSIHVYFKTQQIQLNKESFVPNNEVEESEGIQFNENPAPAVTPQTEIASTSSSSNAPYYNTVEVSTSSKRSASVKYSQPVAKRAKQLKIYGAKNTNELSEKQKTDLDLSLLKLIVTDFQPVSIVENRGFIEYTKKLNPLYTLPSRQVLTNRLLPEKYVEIQTKIKTLLGTVQYVSLTTDIWQSDSNKSYISVTCHFINNMKLCSQTLSVKELEQEHHTGRNVADHLSKCIEDWNLDNKIVTFISDNGSNIKNAIIEHLRKNHHPCVAHTLNLSTKESLNGNAILKNIIIKSKRLVGYFKHSGLATMKLKNCQEQMNLPVLKVKQAVDTRWNSVLLMLERLLIIKDSLTIALTNLPAAPENLDASEWAIVIDCVPILKPMELLTSELSAEKYITMSLIVPLVRGLQWHIKDLKPMTDVGLWLQNQLIEIVSRRLGSLEENKIVAKSTFLDPRFKKTGFGLEANANNAQSWIIDELTSMISATFENADEASDRQEQVTKPSESDNVVPTSSKICLWSHFDQKLAKVKTKTTPSTSAALCVRQYLELPYCPRSDNPLDFWEKHKNSMPELYRLHLKYLCVPATSVPSERLFSKAGQLTNLRRNRLAPKNLDMILFLNGCL
ncbi:unnamed protein product [Diabrotica balteata]|uniref:HAT C-terminal dimerisation domain-containing protein n=1 Tax=Diabrotica balteata TaxID=107213 RepID=A0A9N9SR54_DIABA|nr:unnamed protein product [Diabrotica balteata]